MPAANFPEYVQDLQDTLNRVIATNDVVLVTLQVDQRSALRGFIAGSLQFHTGTVLHFREFVDTSQMEQKLMYAYHCQDVNNNLIFRYDNASHRPAFSQPEHRHTRSGVEASSVPTLSEVLDQILRRTG